MAAVTCWPRASSGIVRHMARHQRVDSTYLKLIASLSRIVDSFGFSRSQRTFFAVSLFSLMEWTSCIEFAADIRIASVSLGEEAEASKSEHMGVTRGL